MVQQAREGHAPHGRARGRFTGAHPRSLHAGRIAWFVLLLAPAVVACGGAVPGAPDPVGVGDVQVEGPTASAAVVARIRVNEKVRVDGLELTVLEAKSFRGTKSRQPVRGYVYVGYKLRIAAVDKQQRIISSNFRVHADGTKEGSFAFVAGNRAWEPTLPFDSLRKGESVTGWLSFQVPEPTRYVSLTYNADEFDTVPDIRLDFPCCAQPR